jgi:hypothetical protein
MGNDRLIEVRKKNNFSNLKTLGGVEEIQDFLTQCGGRKSLLEPLFVNLFFNKGA